MTDYDALVERADVELAFVKGDAAAWGVDTYGDLPRTLQLIEDLATALRTLREERDGLREEATFLLDRLDEIDWSHESAERDFHGHVVPSMERLRSRTLSKDDER